MFAGLTVNAFWTLAAIYGLLVVASIVVFVLTRSRPESDFSELVARVRAIFRRCAALQGHQGAAASSVLQHDGLSIDLDSRQVTVDGRAVDLTAREFDLLVHFARHSGRVYTRAQLLDQVWGYGHDGYEHTVNSHINRLRSKIEPDPSRPRYVVTVWGVGYRLGDPTLRRRRPQDVQHALS